MYLKLEYLGMSVFIKVEYLGMSVFKAWISRDECTKLQELSLLWNLNYIEEENEPRYTYFPSLHTAKIFSVDIDLGTVRTKLSRLF